MTGRCGICHRNYNLVGPFAGGPFIWYCRSCREIIEDYEDTKVSPNGIWAKDVINIYLRALEEHKAFMKRVIENFKVSKGMEMCFANDETKAK